MTNMASLPETHLAVPGYDFYTGPVATDATPDQVDALYVADKAADLYLLRHFVPSTLMEMRAMSDPDEELDRIMGDDAFFVSKRIKLSLERLNLVAFTNRSAYDVLMLSQLQDELKQHAPDAKVVPALESRMDGIPQLVRHHDQMLMIGQRAIGMAPVTMNPKRDSRHTDPYTALTKEGKAHPTVDARIAFVIGDMSVHTAKGLAKQAALAQKTRYAHWDSRLNPSKYTQKVLS